MRINSFSLHNKGYAVTEIFDNGFSVYLKFDEEVVHFQRDSRVRLKKMENYGKFTS